MQWQLGFGLILRKKKPYILGLFLIGWTKSLVLSGNNYLDQFLLLIPSVGPSKISLNVMYAGSPILMSSVQYDLHVFLSFKCF